MKGSRNNSQKGDIKSRNNTGAVWSREMRDFKLIMNEATDTHIARLLALGL